MVLSLNPGAISRLALAAAVAVSMAACASKPKPKYPATTPAPSAGAQAQPPRTELPPVTSSQTGALPGSTQDFVVNVGDRVYFDLDSSDVREDGLPILD